MSGKLTIGLTVSHFETVESVSVAASCTASVRITVLFTVLFADGLLFAEEFCMMEKFDAFQISKKFYIRCKLLKLPIFLRDQMLRASSSIGLNLAEGSGKRTPADQRRYYGIAYGSLRECQAIIELEEIEDSELRDLANKLGAILYTLSHRKLKKTAPKTAQ